MDLQLCILLLMILTLKIVRRLKLCFKTSLERRSEQVSENTIKISLAEVPSVDFRIQIWWKRQFSLFIVLFRNIKK